MNTFVKMLVPLTKRAGRAGLVLRKYSPEILMGTGVVGIVTSTVLACRATLKVDSVLIEAEEKKDKIEAAKEKFGEEKYSEADYKKDLQIVKVQTGVEFVKLYAPAVTLGIVSIGCMLGAHGIMKKRNVALMAAYKLVEGSFKDYRRRVIEDLGAEKDLEYKTGIKRDAVERTEMAYTDDNGDKHEAVTKKFNTRDPNQYSEYARFYDEGCINWSKTPEHNMYFLKAQQNFVNDLLHSRGHVFLNEVYDVLGIPRSQAGSIVGWVLSKDSDNYIDFGIYDFLNGNFVNGYETNILLDFNVDGVIWDKI